MITAPSAALVERAAAFIDLANQQATNSEIAKVAESMLLATARYCAHVESQNALSAEAMRQDRDAQLETIVEKFRARLEGEYDFYVEKFDELVLRR